MARVAIQPGRSAMEKAWTLGRRMASEDPRFRPVLADAGDYATFEKFRSIHRGQLEVREAFAVWDEQIMRIAEREGSRLGFRTDGASAYWDVFLAKVVVPLKGAFWTGWESKIRLGDLYAAARNKAITTGSLSQTPPSVFRATQVVAKIEKPEIEETSEFDFVLSVTETPGSVPRAVGSPDVAVLAASKLLERVNVPEVEQATDDAFLLSVTENPEAAKKPASSVLAASKLVDRVPRPEVEDTSDDAFLMSVTQNGATQTHSSAPASSQASIVPGAPAAAAAVPGVNPTDISDEDLWHSVAESPIQPTHSQPTTASAAPPPPANPLADIDEDLGELYK